ncbi:MAG: hypothetical protein ACPG51_09530 [Thiolinea sp.]
MKTALFSITLLFAVSSVVIASETNSHDQHKGMNHSQHMAQMKNTVSPKEAGHGGFAAIAEVVGILQANPDTDWSTVNINALRDHLLDMDRLVTGAVVNEQAITAGMRFNVTGSDQVLNAIQSMVPAHAGELNKMPEFTATTEAIENGIALIITGKNEGTIARIKGLGFFGLMATGSHHQTHHYMMATGQDHGMHH